MKMHSFSLIPVFAALTAAGAFIKLPVPPVPITAQILFVAMSGMLLGPKAGAASQLVYLIVGLIGLPVFSGGGGPAYVASPTFGYLLGFIPASALAGFLMKGRPFTPRTILPVSGLSMLTVYIVGVPWFAFFMACILHKPDALWIAVKSGFAIFIPGDIVKCLVLAAVMPRLGSLMRTGSSG
ncbi:MAG TPA: biotin transporter BioY [Deltaproteobacteria bacterium]|jgi:biotin transport system substrate-specific component|nr:biotin transporter BioY [Deltaproteobacteria bacterium]HQH99815.1 biotin transporter BioY [Deltaproteobacteria bacterium]HQJ09873.1 biotin transporter BioY [Deltaproteobacteria bacterium]